VSDSQPPRSPGRTSSRRRSAARLAAVQALYQLDVNRTELTAANIDAVVREFFRHRFDQEGNGDYLSDVDRDLFVDIVRGATGRREDLDRLVSTALTEDWPLQRLELVLRAILRAGAYELWVRRDVPARVAINEYLEVAHAFFSGKEPSLVNGVLDRLARELRAHEF
jgi:transcription antitermination protein NusB